MPGEQIVYLPVESIAAAEKNPRTHSKVQVAQIVAAMKEFGWTNPILVDEENTIIAGHGRLEAAKQLEVESVPCIVLSGLTKAQKRALVIADNQLALNAGWDADLLKFEIGDLKIEGFDVALLGFSDFHLDAILTDGWNSDIKAVERHQENLDGIPVKILIEMPPKTDRDAVIEKLKAAMKELGIDAEFK